MPPHARTRANPVLTCQLLVGSQGAGPLSLPASAGRQDAVAQQTRKGPAEKASASRLFPAFSPRTRDPNLRLRGRRFLHFRLLLPGLRGIPMFLLDFIGRRIGAARADNRGKGYSPSHTECRNHGYDEELLHSHLPCRGSRTNADRLGARCNRGNP